MRDSIYNARFCEKFIEMDGYFISRVSDPLKQIAKSFHIKRVERIDFWGPALRLTVTPKRGTRVRYRNIYRKLGAQWPLDK